MEQCSATVCRDDHGAIVSFPSVSGQVCFRYSHGDDVGDSLVRIANMAWSAGLATGTTTARPSTPPPSRDVHPPSTPPRPPPRPIAKRVMDSPKRTISARQLMRHKRHFNSTKGGLIYCLSKRIGVRVKSLHRFAGGKYKYELDVRHRTSMERRRVIGIVEADGGQFKNEYYTTTAPRFKIDNNTGESTWFKLCQTRGEVSDGLQSIHLSGNFADRGTRATGLHEWTVDRIFAK